MTLTTRGAGGNRSHEIVLFSRGNLQIFYKQFVRPENESARLLVSFSFGLATAVLGLATTALGVAITALELATAVLGLATTGSDLLLQCYTVVHAVSKSSHTKAVTPETSHKRT